MSHVNKLLKGSVVLILGRVGGYVLSFARNVVIARLLPKADLGLAVMFGTTITLMEIAGRMCFGQQLVQAKQGATDEFLAASHLFQFLLASFGAVLVLLVSGPLAVLLHVPGLQWAFAALAVIPLSRGFENLDNFRQQRELNFTPAALCEVIPHVVITLAAWPLAVWLRDFRAIIWLLIIKGVVGILVTHLVARQSYRWSWNRLAIAQIWTFGWPLLLTNLLMFASQQADQMLVGAFISLEDLARYSLSVSMVAIPWFIFSQVGTSLILPMLAKAQDDQVLFWKYYRACMVLTGVGAIAVNLPLIVAGEQLIVFCYGAKYAGCGPLVALLTTAIAVRFVRFVPNTAAMARADTINQLYSNLWRTISLPLAALVVLGGGGVLAIAACPLAAEIAAAAFSVWRLRNRQGVPLRDTLNMAAYLMGFICAGLGLLWLGAPHWKPWMAGAVSLGMVSLSLLTGWLIYPQFAQQLTQSICQWRRRNRLEASAG